MFRLQIGTLIAATSLVQLANGFFTTFVSLRVAVADFGPELAGLVLSAYFAGFTIGAVWCPSVIQRIGHIRAYAAFAGMVVAATAAMPLLVGPYAWMLARAAVGVGCVGLFITTESWLNAKADRQSRGRVFSVYMVGTFLALAVGQLLVGRLPLESAGPFNVIVALFAIALAMVATTHADPPVVTAEAKLPYGDLSRAAPVAVVGCVVAGMVGSAFYALMPAWMQGEGVSHRTIAVFMLVAVLGGLAFQVPVGRLSDRLDRRHVLAGLSFGFAVAAVALVLAPRTLGGTLPVALVLGGFMSTLYPVCVAHALDRMPTDRVVAVSGRLIFVSGLGSAVGPLLGSAIMGRFDIDGLLYLMAAATVLLAVVALARTRVRAAPEHSDRPFDILAPQAVQIAHDPQGAADAASAGEARPAPA